VQEPYEEKSDDSKDSFYGNESRFSIIFPSTISKFCWDILKQNCGERIFSNRQLGMRVNIRIVIIMCLE
jgi:hypothetical protein